MFKCSTCPDYAVCSKCLPHRKTFHTKETQGDEKEHKLEERAGYREYRDMLDEEEQTRDGLVLDQQVVDEEKDKEASKGKRRRRFELRWY